MCKKPKYLIALCLIPLLSACAANSRNVKTEKPESEPKRAASVLPVENPHLSTPNLLTETTYVSYFRDLRALQVGDVVTINIVETSKASKKASTVTERNSSINAGISNLLGYEQKMGKIFPDAFDNEVMFKASMANQFDGSGSTSRDETMVASITARVMDVLPNGYLHIRGTREVRVNNESQFITLSGIVRPIDISPDNTILSSFISDAKIEYTGQGSVSDKQRPGWLMRVVDLVWPF